MIDLNHLRKLAGARGVRYWLLWTELDRRIRLGYDDDPAWDYEMEVLRTRMDIECDRIRERQRQRLCDARQIQCRLQGRQPRTASR